MERGSSMIKRLRNLYTTERTYMYEVPTFTGKPVQIRSNTNTNILVELHPKGILYVYKGYSFDGCTPKFQIELFTKKIIFGTSDGDIGEDGYPELFHASLKHDVLCQLFSLGLSPYNRESIDKQFKQDMKKVKWSYRGLYYSAIRLYAKVKGYK
jgi:hypothetical protein